MMHHPLRVSLDHLERRRAKVWQSGMGRDREQVATGLVAALAAERIHVEFESVDWAGRAEIVNAALKHVEAVREIADELGDKQAVILSLGDVIHRVPMVRGRG